MQERVERLRVDRPARSHRLDDLLYRSDHQVGRVDLDKVPLSGEDCALFASGRPRWSELLFGAAAGAKVTVGTGATKLVVGREVFGATAFKSLFGKETTALEGLLSGRLEGTGGDGAQLRVRAGVGLGINDAFGAPEWRAVIGIELFDHSSAGTTTGSPTARTRARTCLASGRTNPKTNGCPAQQP